MRVTLIVLAYREIRERGLAEVEDVGDGALALVVEGGVVGGVVEDAVDSGPEGGAASSVEVYCIGAAELAHEVGELGDGHALGVAGVAAIDGEEDDVALASEADGCAGVRGEGECAGDFGWGLWCAGVDEKGAAGEDCADGVGVGLLGAGIPREDFECAVYAADCSVAAVGFGWCRGGDEAGVFFEEADGVAVCHVEVGAVDGYGGMVCLRDFGG